MALLERLTKDNFVDHPPFFTVYDYWYNALVDRINSLATADGVLGGTTYTYIYGGTTGIVNIEGVGIYDGMVEATNLRTSTVTLTATQIVGTAAGDLGHANGATLYSPATTNVAEFVSAVLVYDYDTAAYTGGGDDTVIRVGTTAVTGAITSASLLGAAADKIVVVYPLSTAGIALVQGESINIFSGTDWTQPGGAAGVLRVFLTFRTHETGL